LTQADTIAMRRRSPFAASILFHVLALMSLWIIRIEAPANRARSYSSVLVYTPPPVEQPPPPKLHAPPVHIPLPVVANAFRAPAAARVRPKTPVLELPAPVTVAHIEVAPPVPPIAPPVVAPPPKQVKIGAFTPQVAAVPQTSLKAPAGSAGFDPVNSQGSNVPARQVASSGAFDPAATVGSGPGRRVVGGSAFGSVGVGQQSSKVTPAAMGGFGDTTIAQGPAAPKLSQVTGNVFRPVEILEKPKPAYTEEARRLGVEGEVVFEAQFTASGHIRILKTVKGLGHGLDETALRAAEAIRFRPAEKDGQPVDFTAAVHILFQLAN